MPYLYQGRKIQSLEELAFLFHQDGAFFYRELKDGRLAPFLEEQDKAKADKIQRILPLSYPSDVFLFFCTYILNPHLEFIFRDKVYPTYEKLGERMLLPSPNIDNLLLPIVTNSLLSRHMHFTGEDRIHPKRYKRIVEIERIGASDHERAYFLLAYELSKKKTILYKGVEYKDVFNLTYDLAKKEKDLSGLGSYLAGSPLLMAYKEYSREGKAIETFLHLVQSQERVERELRTFVERRRKGDSSLS